MSEGSTSSLRVFTKESLIEHAKQNPSTTFISIHENVYDVTPFLDEHPGGEEALKEHNIKTEFRDATESFEDTGHSMDARDMMKKYQIGTMEYKREKPKVVKTETNAKNQQENSSFLYWVVPGILAIVLALSYQYFTHRS